MTILDIPMPQGALTRPQVRAWADKVYDAFIDFLSKEDFWGHETPTEDDPEGWEGDYKYESMSVADMITLLTNNRDERYAMIGTCGDVINIKISADLAAIFSQIIANLGNWGRADHLSMNEIHSRILNILFTFYNNNLKNQTIPPGNEINWIPRVARRDFKYFCEQFYDIVDSAVEITLDDMSEHVQVLQSQKLYYAEKARNSDAIQQRTKSKGIMFTYLRKTIDDSVRDIIKNLNLDSYTVQIIDQLLQTMSINRLYEMMPTLVTTEDSVGIRNSDITELEDKLSKQLFKIFKQNALSDTKSSPGVKQANKSSAPYERQTQILPSDKPYEV